MPREIDWEPLVEAALDVRRNAHAPYSRFRVGAAMQMEDGTVYRGCNVENRSFGLTVCAERAAIAAAVADGQRQPAAIAVVTDTDPPAAPCGSCRESLAEFAGPELPILMVNLNGKRRMRRLGELFPEVFEFPARESG